MPAPIIGSSADTYAFHKPIIMRFMHTSVSLLQQEDLLEGKRYVDAKAQREGLPLVDLTE